MDADYETKKKMLFESLESAEKNLQGTSLEQTKRDYNNPLYRQERKRPRDEYVEKYKHKDSLFKRPDLPINKCLRSRQRPEYEKNPNKWQHYTLDDIDTSERTNTTAAFSFLKELEDRKHLEEETEGTSGNQKIVFKKSTKLKPRHDEVDPQLNLKKIQSTKIVMPEYVVGEKRQKPKKIHKPKDNAARTAAALRLSHLNEDEEEEI